MLKSEDGTVVYAHSVVIATGATARRLGVEGEEKLWQRGVSACAVCDGGLPIFRNKHVLVVGGGDTAMEEALHLTKFASQVTLVHRRDAFRASKVMAERVLNHPKIQVVWDSTLVSVFGEKNMEGAKIKNLKTGVITDVEASGLFYAIGHKPNTDFLKGKLELNDVGYIVLKGKTNTSVPGVFAAGDVSDPHYRQAVVAAGSGASAALDCEKWLISQKLI
jgi:thioredoxin reductase (NADPH)